VEVDGAPALAELDRRGVEVDSMGRTPAEDPAFFLAGGAAGILAARMASGSRTWSADRPGR
jgi:NADPH-dependent 2,4-dienoyl-CoA reductase/sulfur reductase-like enzyme